MALRPVTDFATDTHYSYTAIQTQPKLDGRGPEAPQKTNWEGVPQWTIDALRTGSDDSSDVLTVTVAAATAPSVTGPVAFENLRGRMWHIPEKDGKPSNAGLSWFADAVSPATASRKSD